MAEKFRNGRWVKDGFLDNRVPGTVVGRISFAAIGPVDFCLRGDFKDDIKGQVMTFENPAFEDDERAAYALTGFDSIQRGDVYVISFDPHPLLDPHPYIEWFSDSKVHYRIELQPGDARIAAPDELPTFDGESRRIRARARA